VDFEAHALGPDEEGEYARGEGPVGASSAAVRKVRVMEIGCDSYASLTFREVAIA
jgi:hypothetical protein